MINKISIAIAEDHTLVRKGIMAMLKDDDNYNIVAEAEHGAALLTALKLLNNPPDICLLDINMPVMNGYETLLAAKALYPGMRYIILTQLEEEFVIVKMLMAGAKGYLLKDADPSELKAAIHNVFKDQYHINRLIDGHMVALVSHNKPYTRLVLSHKEEEFLKLCCTELPYKAIAFELGISERTVAFYRMQLFEKLGVKSRTGLALSAIKLGLVNSIGGQ